MNLYAGVLCAIVLLLLGLAVARAGKVKTKTDFMVAGRSLPAGVLVLTLLSSWIGSGSLLGGAENAYNHGLVALWQAAGGWAGLLLIYFIAPRARKFAQFTIPDLLEARYSETARILGTIAILFAFTGISSYQFIGGGDILNLIFPGTVSPLAGRIIIAAFVIVFTAIAGMSSVAYMDVAVGSLACFALLGSLPFLLHSAGGTTQFVHSLPPSQFTVLGVGSLVQALELFVPTCLLMLGNQAMYQKFFSARSERDARVAVVGWIIGTVILETAIVLLAMLGHSLALKNHSSPYPREIIAYTGLHSLPSLMGALLMGAVFAKILSTANNFLFSASTNLVNDIYVRYLAPQASNKNVLLISRLTVALLGCWALYQSLHTESVLKKTLYAYTIYAAALTPVTLAAFYWRRANAAGAVSAIAAGTLMTVCWDLPVVHNHLPLALAARDAIFPALFCAVVALVGVSLATAPPAPEKLSQFS